MQVILSFLIAAWLTYALALVTFLFAEGALDGLGGFTTEFDFLMIKLVKRLKLRMWNFVKERSRLLRVLTKLTPSIAQREGFTKEQMQGVCLMLLDQQLITGSSILLVAFSKHIEITEYHFYIATNLSLASFATIQAVVFLVRDLLDDPFRKGWRMLWIVTIFATSITGNVVWYNEYFLNASPWGAPMRCV